MGEAPETRQRPACPKAVDRLSTLVTRALRDPRERAGCCTIQLDSLLLSLQASTSH